MVSSILPSIRFVWWLVMVSNYTNCILTCFVEDYWMVWSKNSSLTFSASFPINDDVNQPLLVPTTLSSGYLQYSFAFVFLCLLWQLPFGWALPCAVCFWKRRRLVRSVPLLSISLVLRSHRLHLTMRFGPRLCRPGPLSLVAPWLQTASSQTGVVAIWCLDCCGSTNASW